MTDKSTNQIWRLLRFSGLFARELVGWALMLAGLKVFWISVQYLNYSQIIEGFIIFMIGYVLFRSGLQLVKVSVAARAFRVDREKMANPLGREYRSA